MRDEYSVKLRSAIDEIKEILTRYDIGAIVTLHDGLGMSEFGRFIDSPSWSNLRFIKDNKAHFKSYMKSDPVNTNKTMNMLIHARDLCAQNFQVLDSIVTHCESYLEIERDRPLTFTRKDAVIRED